MTALRLVHIFHAKKQKKEDTNNKKT